MKKSLKGAKGKKVLYSTHSRTFNFRVWIQSYINKSSATEQVLVTAFFTIIIIAIIIVIQIGGVRKIDL